MSETESIEALRKKSVKVIVPQLETLSDAALAELLALEQNDGNPRESLVHAITTAQAERAKAVADAAVAAPVAAADPAWLAADYLGPLTGDQAQARLARFGHHTKPVDEAVTK